MQLGMIGLGRMGANMVKRLTNGGHSCVVFDLDPKRAPEVASGNEAVTAAADLPDLIGKLTAGGAGPQVNSWVGPGANEPIQPGQLGSALGQNTLNELSQRTGMSQQELLNQLATVLPQLINNLTPKGRMPTLADFEK